MIRRALGVAFVAAALLALTGAATASADVGSPGPSFAGASAPTGQKPQSKVWFNDGSWWGVLYNASRGQYEIFRRDNGTWTTTGAVVDTRDKAWADVLWDGTSLHVIVHSATTTATGSAVKYTRWSYDGSSKTYTRNVAPVTLSTFGVEAAVLDKDSTGTVWVTYTQNSQVFVTHSGATPATWVAPYVIPTPGASAIDGDDISTVIAFNGRIGVMWSDQADGSFRWAVHVDGQPDSAWTESVAAQGVELSDDHMNLKTAPNDPAGQVFGVVKTSLNRSTDPMHLLLVLDNAGTWHQYTAFRVGDGTPTRAQLALDPANRRIYVFASAPCCSGGTVSVKQTSMDNIALPTGSGTTILQSTTDTHINNPSTGKAPVTAASGLLVLAGDDTSDRYWHTVVPLGTDIDPPQTTITAGPAASTTSTSAQFSFSSSEAGSQFECGLDGAAPSSCSSPVTYSGLGTGSHTFQVRARDTSGNVDPTPAVRTWTITGAAALFADDFELGDFSRWTSVLKGADGTATVQSTTVAAGSFAARLSATALTGSFAYARRTLSPAPTTIQVSGDFRIDGEGVAGGNVPLLRLYDATGARVLTIYRPNGSTKLYVGQGGVNTVTTGRLVTGTWGRLTVQGTTDGAGASDLTVLLDGTRVYTSPTASLGSTGIGTIQIGNDTKRQPFVVAVDDVEVQ